MKLEVDLPVVSSLRVAPDSLISRLACYLPDQYLCQAAAAGAIGNEFLAVSSSWPRTLPGPATAQGHIR
jgi:hypothetical protein